jgi:MFS family permease
MLVTATTSLILTTAWGGKEYAWSSPVIMAMAFGGVAVAVAFVRWERRAPEPIIPMHLFSNRVFASSIVVLLLVGSLLMSTDSFLPLFMQTVIGASATTSGLLLMPLMAGILTTSISTGRLVARTGRYKIFPVVGLGFCSTAVLLFTRLNTGTGRFYVSAVQFLMGLGIGATMPTTSVAIQNSVQQKDMGVATAAAQFARSFGGALGLAGYGAVFASRINGKLPADLVRRVEDPRTIRALPADLRTPVQTVLASGVRGVYVFALPVMCMAWVIMWFMKELPLRATTAMPATVDDGGDGVALATH